MKIFFDHIKFNSLQKTGEASMVSLIWRVSKVFLNQKGSMQNLHPESRSKGQGDRWNIKIKKMHKILIILDLLLLIRQIFFVPIEKYADGLLPWSQSDGVNW